MAKERTLNELRQSKSFGYKNPRKEEKTIGNSIYQFDIIEFENYIFPEILNLQKQYPNDQEFGKHVRRLLISNNQKKMFPGIQNL